MSAPIERRIPPTAEQKEALDVIGSSVGLSAGAGCGKTFVLAERFVKALEGPEGLPLGRVVALTFTNKAARELRDRIRKECRIRLVEGREPERWRKVLRGLVAARIGTFHSFCGDVLRRHAVEAKVDPGFTVLDESIALSIREQALDASLRDRLAFRDPDLIELAVEYGLGMVRRSLDDLLDARTLGDLGAWTARRPEELVEGWVEAWEEDVRPTMLRTFHEGAEPCLRAIASMTFDHDGVRARVGEFRDAMASFGGSVDPAAGLEQVRSAARIAGLAAKHWPSLEGYELIKDHFTKIRKDAEKCIKAMRWDERLTQKAAEHGLMLARLAVRASEVYQEAKRARGGIDNDDLLLRTRDLLSDPSNGVREALAGSVDLLLVDEFQDTDPIQSAILEGLAGANLADGKLFLVGDFKQSIYRFRGARPDLFVSYRDRFPAAGRRALSGNFRSVPAILDFVNALFASTFTEPEAALVAGIRPNEADESPHVEFLWAPVESKSTAAADAHSRRRAEARRVAHHLRTRLKGGWPIRDRTTKMIREANQGDVAILFRSLSDSAEYEQALVAEDLDFHVVGGSGFYAQQEVLDLINVLTAVDDPLDSIALAGALRSPFFSISDDALFWLTTHRQGIPHAGLELCDGELLETLPLSDRPRAERARRLLASWRSVKDRLPIARLVDRILADSCYEVSLIAEFLGDRKRANARKLVELARRFDEQGGFTLADFVARLRADLRGATKETQAATTDAEGQVIRLMSIHQAKGLEFPIVVVPDLDRKRPGTMDRVAFDPELGPLVNPIADARDLDTEGDEEGTPGGCLGWSIHRHRELVADDAEALRLFYVATTRARDFLVISSATDPTAKPVSPAMVLLDDRFDRETGLLKSDLPVGWTAPRIRVVPPTQTAASSSSSRRPKTPLLDLARAIREGSDGPLMAGPSLISHPRYVILDPAQGLPAHAARVDRLTRSILADPRSLEPGKLAMVAEREARLQNSVASEGLIRDAIARVERWARSPEAKRVERSTEVIRDFDWAVHREVGPDRILFRGRGDLLYRRDDGTRVLVAFGDATADSVQERLRLLLSCHAAHIQGRGEVQHALWISLSEGLRTVRLEAIDEPAIDRTVREFLAMASSVRDVILS